MSKNKGKSEEQSFKIEHDKKWYGGNKTFSPKDIVVKKKQKNSMSSILKLISKTEVAKNPRKYTQII